MDNFFLHNYPPGTLMQDLAVTQKEDTESNLTELESPTDITKNLLKVQHLVQKLMPYNGS